MPEFKLVSDFKPAGDQPRAIESLLRGIREGKKNQVLLGVTGSGKTFTMANVIEKLQRPTLVLSHNKTLAAQLYSEFRDFFPDNSVAYFVSYYDITNLKLTSLHVIFILKKTHPSMTKLIVFGYWQQVHWSADGM